MFYELANSAYGFWIVAFLIALIDSAVLLKRGQFLFSVDPQGYFEVRAAEAPFLLRNRELVFTLISYFQSPFYLSSIDAPTDASTSSLNEVIAHAKKSRPLQVFSAICLIATSVGLIGSVIWGLGTAILPALCVLYLNSLSAILFLCLNRRDLRLSKFLFWQIAGELLLCPFLAMNLFKKASFHGMPAANTWSIVDDGIKKETIRSNLKQFDDYSGEVGS